VVFGSKVTQERLDDPGSGTLRWSGAHRWPPDPCGGLRSWPNRLNLPVSQTKSAAACGIAGRHADPVYEKTT
jgi:hypothetical protein